MPIILQKYQCDECKQAFNWSDDSTWFGSYRDLESHPERIKTFCTEKCAEDWGVKNDNGFKHELTT